MSTDRLANVNLYAGMFVLAAVLLLIVASFFVASKQAVSENQPEPVATAVEAV